MAEVEQPQEPQVVRVPEYYAMGVQSSTDGKDFQIVFTKRVVMLPVSDETIHEPVAVVNMSRGSVADLHASLEALLGSIEKDFGPVNTPYLQERKTGK